MIKLFIKSLLLEDFDLDAGAGGFDDDENTLRSGKELRAFYKPVDKTKEYAEN